MRIALMLSLSALPLVAQDAPTRLTRPTTEAEWAAYELPAEQAALTTRLRAYEKYCAAKDGLKLAPGAAWTTDTGVKIVLHSHPTFDTPLKITRDRDGNVTSITGGQRILVLLVADDVKLATFLCIPRVAETTDREVLARMVLKIAGARFIREIPETWKPTSEVTQ